MSLNVIALGGNAILDTDPTDEGQKPSLITRPNILQNLLKGNKSLSVTETDHREFAFTTKAGESEKIQR